MGKVQKPERKLTELEKLQMDEINRLQEKVKLYEFDISKDRHKIKELQTSLKRKTRTINSVIQELELMRKENNYKRLLIVINVLKKISKEGYNE